MTEFHSQPPSYSAETGDPTAAQSSNWGPSIHAMQTNVTPGIEDLRLSSLQSNTPPAPVVLSLAPPEPYTEVSESRSTLNTTPHARASPSEPFGSPPAYNTVRRPTRSIVYTFSPLSFNSMLLVPPANAPDSRAVYHISVSFNCFIPSSFITTIRRGATEYGEYVGEFEMGISNKPGTVCTRGKEKKISDVLGKVGPRSQGKWTWTFARRPLFWDLHDEPKICYSEDRTIMYAKFVPAKALCLSDEPAKLTRLEISPAGQELLDDILMSALVIER